MNDRRLRNEFRELQMSYANVVDANIFLVDENKLLKNDIQKAKSIIDEILKFIEYSLDADAINMAFSMTTSEFIEYIKSKIELKGSDKE